MVCPRCVKAVEDSLEKLDIPFLKVNLGSVQTEQPLSVSQREQFNTALHAQGFEILSKRSAQIIATIKTLIIQQIHHKSKPLSQNFSVFLSKNLGYDYQHLSRMFSEVEGITINRYIIIQKIEKAKELLFYDELSSNEIADQLGYNSIAYLSKIFKKETGMTLSQFKKLHQPGREGIDKL